MATTVDEFITKYTLDPSGYVTGAQTVHRTTTKLAQDTDSLGNGMKSKINGALSEIGGAISAGLNVITTYFTAVAAVAGAYVAFGVAAVKAAADHDALVKSLEAVVGGAGRAKIALTLLEEAAKKPGLGQEEAIGGFTQLVNAGLSEKMSMSLVREMANANARAGGSKDSFAHIMMIMAKMANTPYLQGDELNQLSEWRIPSYKMVKDKFGTSDTDELKKRGITSQMVIAGLVESMSQMERAGDSLKNELDNESDAMNLAMVSMGQSIATHMLPSLKAAREAVEEFTKSGVFAAFTENLMNMINLPTDKTAMEDFLLDALEIATVLAASIRNIILNLSAMFELIKAFSPFLRLLPEITGHDISPQAEGEKARRTFEMQLELGRKRAKLEKPITDADLLDKAPGAVAPASVGERIAEFTRQTAENTKALRDAVRDGVLGGGMIGSKGITQREMARFTSRVLDARGA